MTTACFSALREQRLTNVLYCLTALCSLWLCSRKSARHANPQAVGDEARGGNLGRCKEERPRSLSFFDNTDSTSKDLSKAL